MSVSAITTYCKTYTGCSLKNIFKNYTGKVVKPAPSKTYNFENDTEYQELIKAIKK